MKKEGRCFLCLQKGHVKLAGKIRCTCNNCSKRHHISICDEIIPDENPIPAPLNPEAT